MAIKIVQIRSQTYPYLMNDCIVFRIWEPDPQHIEVAFPFHEDTPNFKLTIPEALAIRNVIDALAEVKLIESKEENPNE